MGLRELRELADAATPGPWDVSWTYGDAKTERYCVLGPKPFDNPIAATSRLKQGASDAEFIAAARTAVPALLDALEDARELMRAFADGPTDGYGMLQLARDRRARVFLDRLAASFGVPEEPPK